MDRIKQALKNVFEEFSEEFFNENMLLGDIPDWDSMNSVNFQIELESVFGVDLSDIVLKEEYKISDLLIILRKAGADI